MNCANHPEITATAFCRECGKPMCAECQRPALGSIFCEAHQPPVSQASPYQTETAGPDASAPPWSAPHIPPPPSPWSSPYNAPPRPMPDESVHPILALLLGLIPGVGAIYNGQYAKGLVHTVIFGLLISAIINTHNGGMEALLGIMIGAWVFYMCFEAYHTARKRRYGVAVEEFSGQFDFRADGSRLPVGAILLMGLGFVLLLDTTDIISIDQFVKYWPVGLILLGVYLLYNRRGPNHDQTRKDAEVRR
jgi:hypothetical protein